MHKTNILVTGTGSLIGQAIIKSILRSHVRDSINIFGCDYFEETIGSYWCKRNFILPDILCESEVEAWINRIKEIIAEYDIEIIFVGVDFELLYFSDMSKEIKKLYNCTVVVSDRKIIEIGNDKYLTYKFLCENGIDVPNTHLLEEFIDIELKYPLIMKPRVGARSRGVKIINDRQECDAAYKQYKDKGFILQEMVGTDNSEYTCGVLCINDRCIDSIVLKRKLKDGNTMVAEYSNLEEEKCTEYIQEIANVLKPYGSCNLQLRIDEKGNPKLFEINPRFSGTTYMRALLGYNEVEYMICNIMGWKEPKIIKKNGRVIRYYDERLL